MTQIQKMLARLHRDEKGATVIEYALIAALVAVVAIAGFKLVGTNVSSTINNVGTALTST